MTDGATPKQCQVVETVLFTIFQPLENAFSVSKYFVTVLNLFDLRNIFCHGVFTMVGVKTDG